MTELCYRELKLIVHRHRRFFNKRHRRACSVRLNSCGLGIILSAIAADCFLHIGDAVLRSQPLRFGDAARIALGIVLCDQIGICFRGDGVRLDTGDAPPGKIVAPEILPGSQQLTYVRNLRLHRDGFPEIACLLELDKLIYPG